jgi:hypothetical protein
MPVHPNFHIIDWFLFFRRLKINHDFHEFIFQFGTVTNTNSTYINYLGIFHLLFFSSMMHETFLSLPEESMAKQRIHHFH